MKISHSFAPSGHWNLSVQMPLEGVPRGVAHLRVPTAVGDVANLGAKGSHVPSGWPKKVPELLISH